MANVNLLVIEQHAVDRLNGVFSGLGSFIVNKAISLGMAVLVSRDLAGQNITESRKGIMKGLYESIAS